MGLVVRDINQVRRGSQPISRERHVEQIEKSSDRLSSACSVLQQGTFLACLYMQLRDSCEELSFYLLVRIERLQCSQSWWLRRT